MHYSNKIPHYIFFLLISFLLISCNSNKNENSQYIVSDSLHNSYWYRQAIVDLGTRITMFSAENGIAISRGVGREVKGKAYQFSNGEWKPFFEFPYSDYPLITSQDSVKAIWTVTHLTHEGAYRPIHNKFVDGKKNSISLPKIMWDEIDHVMFKGVHQFSDGTAWMVGQQGRIVYYNGEKWSEVESPLIHTEQENVYDGDLNDICMTSKNTGWAVGRNGIIIRFENGKWKKFTSPVSLTLNKISMANDSLGWAVGEKGTILKCIGLQWIQEKTELKEQLFSVKVLNENNAWIVGNSSILLNRHNGTWKQDESIKIYDDIFLDVDIIQSANETKIWIIGNQGIYTNSASTGLSFTDITGQASLRRTGKTGIFFQRSATQHPNILVVNEDDANLLYKNDGSNRYTDVTADAQLTNAPRNPGAIAIADVNNDGEQDILQILDQTNFKLFLGKSTGGYRDWTVQSKLVIDDINSIDLVSAKFIDFNNDGNLDIYISNYDASDMLFAGDGTGRFSKITSPTGIKKILGHASYGASFADFNNDGLVDIVIPYYVSYKKNFFDIFLNKGNFYFEAKSDSNFISSSDISPTVVVPADFNNDGTIDLYIHSQKIPPLLLLNDGKANFRNISTSAHLTDIIPHLEPSNGVVAAADVNNDGWIDVFDGSKLYLNSPSLQFKEISERVGIQFIGNPSFADIDNDGDLDLFLGSTRGGLGKGDRAALFRNNLHSNNFISLRIFPSISNQNGIGTKIIFTDQHGKKIVRVIGLGINPMSSHEISEVLFPMVDTNTYNAKIFFPSGIEKSIGNIHGNQTIDIYETAFFLHRYFFQVTTSCKRTLRLLHWKIEIIKLTAFFLFLFGSIYAGKKYHARKFIQSPWFSITMLFIYLTFVHLLIYESLFSATVISFLSIIVISGSSIAVARVVIQRREAQYISHFKILELLGVGGMGKVYKAIDTNSKNVVAIKILNPELLKDPENRRRLSAEGHLLASFNHPNIVKVFEVGESKERGFIAMEYLSGGTLKQKLEKDHPLSIAEIKNYLLQVCDGLSEVHRNGIVHRDMKTGNLMLTGDNSIRIMDFGLSKSPLVTTMTSLGTVLGTLGYVAPEQVTSLNVDQRTDIFSLGVIMYELLTNQMPFKGENEIALIHSIFNTVPPPPSQLRNDLPKDWDAIVMKCLAKDIEQRFVSAADIRKALPN